MAITEIDKTDKQKLYHDILSIAEIIFVRDGYSATTMDSVAEKADLSKNTLYLYFKNKDQLFYSILENKIDIYTEKLKTDISSAISLNDLIDRIVNHQFDFLSQNNNFFKLAILEQCKINQGPSITFQKKIYR